MDAFFNFKSNFPKHWCEQAEVKSIQLSNKEEIFIISGNNLVN